MTTSQSKILFLVLSITRSFENQLYSPRKMSASIDMWEGGRFALRARLLKMIGNVDILPVSLQEGGIKAKIWRSIALVNFILEQPKGILDVIIDHPRGEGKHSEYVEEYVNKIASSSTFILRKKPLDSRIRNWKTLICFSFFPVKMNGYYELHYRNFLYLICFCWNLPQMLLLTSSFSKKIKKDANCKISVGRFLILRYLIFGLKKNFWKNYFIYHGVQRVALVSSYARTYFVQAANELSIETYEIQHGIITDLHLGYEGVEKLKHFPKNIVIWGNIWNEAFRKGSFNFYVLGCKSIREKCLKASITGKKSKMVFLGQIDHSRILEAFMYKIANEAALRGIEIVLKIHPGDNVSRYKKVEHVRVSNKNLYDEIADAKWVMGTGSTAMYEALASGSRVCIFNDYGHEYLGWLLSISNGSLVNLEDSLDAALEKAINWDLKKNDFF